MSDTTRRYDIVDVRSAVLVAIATYAEAHPDAITEAHRYMGDFPLLAVTMPDGSVWKLRLEEMPVYQLM